MNVFDFFGSAVCHQMAERSFFWGNCQSPLCARCTAIEGGIILGVIFLWLAGRKDGNRPFSPSGMVLAALSFLPIAIDGVGSYLGFWQSNNLLRVLTGALAGYGLPGLFLLAANFSPAKENTNPVYKNTGEQIGLLLAAVAYGLLVWLGILPYFLVAIVSAVGVVCFYGCFWFLILRTVTAGKKFPCFSFSLAGGLFTVFVVATIVQRIS